MLTKPKQHPRRPWVSALAVVPIVFFGGCGNSGVAAVRIDLRSDFSGSLTTASLLVPTDAAPIESQSGGVQWADRANLYCAQGTFDDISSLTIEDLSFRAGSTSDFHYLRVNLPRGDDARWPTTLTPPRADRKRVEQTFDPKRSFRDAASMVAIEVTVPGDVISHAIKPASRGVTSDQERRRLTLTFPVDRARTAGNDFVWLITWK